MIGELVETTGEMETTGKGDSFKKGMAKAEKLLASHPNASFGDDCCPLVHTFADGAYIREITMPKGMLVTSKIHKICHPYFVLRGEVSVLTDKGVVRIKAPFSGITEPGTKRLLYMHEETVWTTVHVTKERELKDIEAEVIAETFAEVPPPKNMEVENAELKELIAGLEEEDYELGSSRSGGSRSNR